MLHIIQDPCSHPAILKAFQTINAKANLIIFSHLLLYLSHGFQLTIQNICRFLTVIKTLVQVNKIWKK